MQNELTISEARQAIQFLQRFVGEVESVKPAVVKHRPILGFNDIIWNDQVIMATFKICSKTVARHRSSGKFPSFRVGRSFYYYRHDILPYRKEFLN